MKSWNCEKCERDLALEGIDDDLALCHPCYCEINLKPKRAKESKCQQCGEDNDLLAQFTKAGVCGKCARKNHKKAIGGGK